MDIPSPRWRSSRAPSGRRNPRSSTEEAPMRSAGMSRRDIVRAMLVLLAGFGVTPRSRAVAEPAEIKLPDGVQVERVDFEAKGIEGWTTVDGQWAVEDMAGAPSGRGAPGPRAGRGAGQTPAGAPPPHPPPGGAGALDTHPVPPGA